MGLGYFDDIVVAEDDVTAVSDDGTGGVDHAALTELDVTDDFVAGEVYSLGLHDKWFK